MKNKFYIYIIRQIMSEKFEIINNKKYKKCNENQIRNLETMRCVLKTSILGKKLLKNNKSIKIIKKIYLKKKDKEEDFPKEVSPEKIKKTSSDKKEDFFNFINKNACVINNDNKLLIDNKIILKRPFGSKSVYGINFISSFVDNQEKEFSSKIQYNSKQSKMELFVLTELQKYKNIHFPKLLGYSTCSKTNIVNLDNLPEFFKKKTIAGYITIFNKLYDGDLKSYIYNIANNNHELWINAIEQIYMSIASFHALGLMHHDCHYGNFLYKKIEKGGYFHYKINGKDYYIKNIGFIWAIWDFGLVSTIFRHTDYTKDYTLLTLFLRKDNPELLTENFKKKFELDKNNHRRWGILQNINIPEKIEEIINNIWILLGKDDSEGKVLVDFFKHKLSEDKWFEILKFKKLLFDYNIPNSSDIKKSTIINFQEMKDFIIDKNKYPIDLDKIKKILLN